MSENFNIKQIVSFSFLEEKELPYIWTEERRIFFNKIHWEDAGWRNKE